MSEMTPLLKALIAAQSEISTAPKNAFNAYDKYNYTSTETLILIAREALHKHGLAVRRKSAVFTAAEPSAASYFEGAAAGVLHVVYCLADGSGNAEEYVSDFPYIVKKGKPFDKAIATALTANLGYFLRDLLQIPRVDPADEMDVGEAASAPGKPAARKATPKADRLSDHETATIIRAAHQRYEAVTGVKDGGHAIIREICGKAKTPLELGGVDFIDYPSQLAKWLPPKHLKAFIDKILAWEAPDPLAPPPELEVAEK